eukprot:jgi/Botrbrau1/20804/Bobra.0156s0033.1
MGRRASPPRGALLCKTLDDCRLRLEKLSGEVAKSEAGLPGRQTWPGLATEFRALRESLLSIHSQDAALNLLTHELAAEVCLRAANYAEFLKTTQSLVQIAFPAAVEETLLSRHLEAMDLLSEPQQHTSSDIKSRWAAASSLYLLYFMCIPPTPQGLDVITVLRRLPRWLQMSAPVAFAIKVHVAVTSGDHLAFLRLYKSANWQQRVIMLPRLQQTQRHGMFVLAAAYHTLACDTAEKWLCVAPDSTDVCPLAFNYNAKRWRSLMKVLAASSAEGNSRIRKALEHLEEESTTKDLLFKS